MTTIAATAAATDDGGANLSRLTVSKVWSLGLAFKQPSKNDPVWTNVRSIARSLALTA